MAVQELNRKVPDDCSITGAPLDRYDEPSNANCSHRKLQISGNYKEDGK